MFLLIKFSWKIPVFSYLQWNQKYTLICIIRGLWLALDDNRWWRESISHMKKSLGTWWIHQGKRKISIFILFKFLGTVLYTKRRVRAYETIRWQRSNCCVIHDCWCTRVMWFYHSFIIIVKRFRPCVIIILSFPP